MAKEFRRYLKKTGVGRPELYLRSMNPTTKERKSYENILRLRDEEPGSPLLEGPSAK